MDKETTKKITKVFDKYAMAFEVDGRYSPKPWVKELIEIVLPELGYHKLPKEKPPLLSYELIEIWEGFDPEKPIPLLDMLQVIAQAQRQVDIKHYGREATGAYYEGREIKVSRQAFTGLAISIENKEWEMGKEKRICPSCLGTKLDDTGKSCWLCKGKGIIEYKVTYPPPTSYIDYKKPKSNK